MTFWSLPQEIAMYLTNFHQKHLMLCAEPSNSHWIRSRLFEDPDMQREVKMVWRLSSFVHSVQHLVLASSSGIPTNMWHIPASNNQGFGSPSANYFTFLKATLYRFSFLFMVCRNACRRDWSMLHDLEYRAILAAGGS